MSAKKLLSAFGRTILCSFLPIAVQTISAAAQPISVAIDQSEVMTIARPAATVIVGNPGIADATILDPRTLVITGHSFGTTNIIVLDDEGQAIASENVSVQRFDQTSVIVHRPVGRETFSCVPSCAPQLAIGDSPSSFDQVQTQIKSHRDLVDGGQ